ncbi:hypothetical protein EVAR_82151_1 [Eumeta japonica]|uniref:Uncharacterized protein n=1 Tax=Eumeta variegata TaxID=151549 RepID=A0A4C1U2A3_EUMVA|nr:hypothetical protein EVAR_82151_1 [Eumeta japonica]
MVPAAHRHSQPQRKHQCFVGILGGNRILNGVDRANGKERGLSKVLHEPAQNNNEEDSVPCFFREELWFFDTSTLHTDLDLEGETHCGKTCHKFYHRRKVYIEQRPLAVVSETIAPDARSAGGVTEALQVYRLIEH